MATTGTGAAAATGRFLVLLLLGLTAPAAALAGYIERHVQEDLCKPWCLDPSQYNADGQMTVVLWKALEDSLSHLQLWK